jgi:hypothetical protein
MNVEIGTEASIFLSWEYLFQIFGILSLQCMTACALIIQAGPSELRRGRDDCVPLLYEPCAPRRRRQLQRARQDGPGLQRQPLPAGERSVQFLKFFAPHGSITAVSYPPPPHCIIFLLKLPFILTF